MCGRYVSVRSVDDLVDEFDVEEVVGDALPPSWNIAPTNDVRIIAKRKPHGRSDDPDAKPVIQLRTARWGLIPSWTKPPASPEKELIPSWAKDLKTQGRMFNARVESVATTSAFKKAYAKRRCLVPADGWYEWKKGDDGTKQAMFMAPPDGCSIAFAGLYEFWSDPGEADTPTVTTCTIITAPAAGPLTEIHDRMPLVLPRGAWSRWLDPKVSDPADLLQSWDEVAGEHLELRPVPSLVNKVDNNGPELIARAEPQPEAQALF